MAQNEPTEAAGVVPACPYKMEQTLIRKEVPGKGNWFQPRPAAIPNPDGVPTVIMTVQKSLPGASDYFSGFSVTRTDDLGDTWTDPAAPDALAWRTTEDGITVGNCDYTLGWHKPTGKIIAIGHTTRYRGNKLAYRTHGRDVAYAVYDPETDTWQDWRVMTMPDPDRFFICGVHGQWLVEPDGTLLVPIYFTNRKGAATFLLKATVARCRFDGETLEFVEHGNVLEHPVRRGLYEKSITFYDGRYYMTMRNDKRGYVSVSDDGMQFEAEKPWTFDDGSDLGSYNTQQKWVTHSDGLFLVYTRRGADNDHIMRHRAPLFIAQVNPHSLQVIRATEQIAVPEHGYAVGNFDATTVTPNETWITVAGGRSDTGFWVTKLLWETPNALCGRVN
jgi:hypothetical protein